MSRKNTEPLLTEDNNRYVMFPIVDDAIWKMYKKQIDCFWRPEEIDLSKDMTNWLSLNEDEQYYIKMILAFFSSSDGIVLENLGLRFMNEVQLSEARAFYGFQIAMENIHSETYSLLIDTYIKDHDEKKKLFTALENFPSIEKKGKWAIKWIQDKKSSFATRLIAFACVEGIFFSGAFCSIYWLKKRGLMPGLTFSNELISKDEASHCYFACLLYSYIKNKLDKDVVYHIFEEAVNIEKEFISESISCNMIGMNSDMMKQYIEFVSDRLLVQLGYEKKWNSENPFDFMELISLRPKSNFFELRVGEYAKSNISGISDNFEMTNDF